jgi:hypothetical protein
VARGSCASRQTVGMRLAAPLLLAVVVLTAACADDGPGAGSQTDGAVVAGVDVVVETLQSGLVGPTQIAADGRGGYVVAELNGDEGDGTGRVLHFASLPGVPTVLVDGLLTPTGVAVDGDLLWIMERRTLSVAHLDRPDEREIVLDDLPFNGRSEGTISPVPGGGILFDTSGRRLGGGELVDGSGVLWYLSGPDAEPEPFATGFKHAYAHAPLPDGRWLVTEISDGRLDAEVPPDELVIAARGDDFAYPRCVGDRTPVGETGGTETECDATPGSLALFAPQSTPTGVAIAPWDPDLALVALWVTGEVVAVPIEPADAPAAPVVIAREIERPQHLLADGDRILATDHATGRIVAIAPVSE